MWSCRNQVSVQEVSLSESGISPLSNFAQDQPYGKLIIEWSTRLRVGDIYEIRLRLVMDNSKDSLNSNEHAASKLKNGLLNDHASQKKLGFLIESRLDIPGMQYQPTGNVREALYPGQQVKFLWTLRPPDAGDYRGTIWVYSKPLSLNSTSQERSVLGTQRIEMRVVELIGMEGKTARILGSVGCIVGLLLGLDKLVFWIWDSLIGFLSLCIYFSDMRNGCK